MCVMEVMMMSVRGEGVSVHIIVGVGMVQVENNHID